MKTLISLLFANMALRPSRALLTALAVIASSCVVIWVVSGYDALLSQSVDENAARALGRFDLLVTAAGGGGPGRGGGGGRPGAGTAAPAAAGRPQPGDTRARPADAAGGASTGGGRVRQGGRGGPGGPGAAGLPPELIRSLKDDPVVAEASLAAQARVSVERTQNTAEQDALRKLLRDDRPPAHGMPPLGPPLIGTDASEPPHELSSGRWIDPSGDKPEAAISASYAKRGNISTGDDVIITSEVGAFPAQITGIVEQPEATGGMSAGIYVSLPFWEMITGYAPRIQQVGLVLKPGTDVSQFRTGLTEKLSSMGEGMPSITDLQALKERMVQGLSQSGSRTLAYSATGIALLAALFIIFTTLSMGVSERTRELAMLRAVSMTKKQVAGLIFLEGLWLALIGWLGGLAAGWGLLAVVQRAKPDLFQGPAALGPWCIALSGIAAVGGALAASILPAWQATRVSPLDAMAPHQAVRPARWIIPSALVGLIFLAVNPALTYVIPQSESSRPWTYSLLGYPAMVIGFILLAPATIVLIEKTLGPAFSHLLKIPQGLLETSLSTNLWRTLGTVTALTVGLGLYIATQTWGYSMLAPFTPGDWVPDMLVGFEPAGLPDDQIDAIRHVPGVISERCLPMRVEQPRLATPLLSTGGTIFKQDNVVLVGVDPIRGLGGNDPIIAPRFMQGDRATAIERLKAGNACIVPDHFLEAARLKMGDTLDLVPPNGPPGQVVKYEIVGAVSLPGWHWMTKMTGLRRQTTRAGALVFTSIDDVKRDFGLTRINFFWFDTEPGTKPAEVEKAMQSIAESHGEVKFQVAGVGEVSSRRPYARLTATETVRVGIRELADGMIWGMSQIPLVTLLITSLAVVNTVVSSVRARQWDMGVLRSIGMTRSTLIRLILAEAILIGLAVTVLGLAFGLMAGWCGTGMARFLSPFGGMATPLVVPWGRMALGVGLTLALCVLAAIWPAFRAGQAEPLSLLRAGRGAL